MNVYGVDQLAWVLTMEKQQRDRQRNEEGYTIAAADLATAFCSALGRLFVWSKRSERQADAPAKLAMQL